MSTASSPTGPYVDKCLPLSAPPPPAPGGGLKSLWASGGAFIQFWGGDPASSDDAGSEVAAVYGAVARGATRLPVRGCGCL